MRAFRPSCYGEEEDDLIVAAIKEVRMVQYGRRVTAGLPLFEEREAQAIPPPHRLRSGARETMRSAPDAVSAA